MEEWLLKKVLPVHNRDSLLGDFNEVYTHYRKNHGALRAHMLVWLQIIKSLPLFFANSMYWRSTMFKNYLKIAFRNIRKHKGFSVINIAGLAIGMTCFILIMLYVQYELSFDKFHENYNRIFRVIRQYPEDVIGKYSFITQTPAPVAPTMVDEFPEVITGTRISDTKGIFRFESNSFSAEGLFADEHFFEIFSFKLSSGDSRTALSEPFSLIISEKLAAEYFNEEIPIGKTGSFSKQLNELLSHNKNEYYDLKITGIMKEIPGNSHFRCDYLISFNTLGSTPGNENRLEKWGSSQYHNYVKLQENSSFEDLNEKLKPFTEKYRGNPVEKYVLQPLEDIHLKTHSLGEMFFTSISDIKYVYIFSTIAFIILVLVCINYMNLSTARFTKRIREIGIRKVVGAQKVQLIRQFMGESLLLSLLGFSIALILSALILPYFNAFVERDIGLNFFKDVTVILTLTGLVLFSGLLSGSYPAFFLASFQPVRIIKGTVEKKMRGSVIRNSLVVLQFSISIILIICTLLVFDQLSYVRGMDVGFNREHIIVIPLRDEAARKNGSVITNELLRNNMVVNVTGSGQKPVQVDNRLNIFVTGENGERKVVEGYDCPVNYNFIDVFGMELVQGRNFSRDFTTDTERAVILNETAVKQAGWDEPVGKTVQENGRRVIGVVKDFHHWSMHQAIEPVGLILKPDEYNYISIKIKPGNIPAALNLLKSTVEKYSPNFSFEYYFFDDYFDNLYKADQKFGSVFTFFSLLSIIISCLGLFGLALFSTEQRTKEIGIRKVLGASVSGVVFLLSKEFTKWVLIANIIAWPMAYYAINRWLQNFAYRTDIGVVIFILSGLLALLIALLTVGFQSVKAAVSNPVDSLRYE